MPVTVWSSETCFRRINFDNNKKHGRKKLKTYHQSSPFRLLDRKIKEWEKSQFSYRISFVRLRPYYCLRTLSDQSLWRSQHQALKANCKWTTLSSIVPSTLVSSSPLFPTTCILRSITLKTDAAIWFPFTRSGTKANVSPMANAVTTKTINDFITDLKLVGSSPIKTEPYLQLKVKHYVSKFWCFVEASFKGDHRVKLCYHNARLTCLLSLRPAQIWFELG